MTPGATRSGFRRPSRVGPLEENRPSSQPSAWALMAPTARGRKPVQTLPSVVWHTALAGPNCTWLPAPPSRSIQACTRPSSTRRGVRVNVQVSTPPTGRK